MGAWERFSPKEVLSLTNYGILTKKHPAHFIVKRSREKPTRALVAYLKINGITEAANINKSKSAQREQEKQQSWRVHFSGCPLRIKQTRLMEALEKKSEV